MKNDFSDTTVIIPTLNEHDNIGKIIKMLASSYSKINLIVADDGSVDGTREAVLNLGRRNSRIRLLDRKNRKVHGLTISFLDAVGSAKTRKLVLMDADMQHPVDRVGEISNALDRYDVVVGVRTSVRNWGIFRRIISKSMAYLAYTVFKIRGKRVCNDIVSGFFGVRKSLMENLIAENRRGFVLTGYKTLLDTLRMLDGSKSIGEVRYSTFHKRQAGESKFKFKHVIDTLRSTFR